MWHSIRWAFIFKCLRTVPRSEVGGQIVNSKMWEKDTERYVESNKEICFISHFYLGTRSYKLWNACCLHVIRKTNVDILLS